MTVLRDEVITPELVAVAAIALRTCASTAFVKFKNGSVRDGCRAHLAFNFDSGIVKFKTVDHSICGVHTELCTGVTVNAETMLVLVGKDLISTRLNLVLHIS